MGTIPRKQVARSKVTCQKIPDRAPSLSKSQVIDRVVSGNDFSVPRPWYLRFLLFYLSPRPSFLRRIVDLSTRLAYTGSMIEIKSSDGLATHNDTGAELVDGPVRCHNIDVHAGAIVLLDPISIFVAIPTRCCCSMIRLSV